MSGLGLGNLLAATPLSFLWMKVIADTSTSEATLLRLFRYLGATDGAMRGAEQELRMWSRGGIHIDVPEERLHLLGISCRSGRGENRLLP
jgi:hypothetical protein